MEVQLLVAEDQIQRAQMGVNTSSLVPQIMLIRQDLQDGRDDHDQRESGTGGDQHPSEQMLVYMDDSSPTTCCNLL